MVVESAALSFRSSRVTGWVASGWPSVLRGVGPPSPARRSKSGESGERVTQPGTGGHPGATRPPRAEERRPRALRRDDGRRGLRAAADLDDGPDGAEHEHAD